MRVLAVALIGTVVGALDGVGIFFAPGERYKWEILFAAILKGILVSWITVLSLNNRTSWLRGGGLGALYGFALALVVFLAKGGLRSMDAPFVVPSGILMGFLTGVCVANFGFQDKGKA